MENKPLYVQQNEIGGQEGQPITAVLRQAGFRASFDAFCVCLSSVLRIKCSAKKARPNAKPPTVIGQLCRNLADENN